MRPSLKLSRAQTKSGTMNNMRISTKGATTKRPPSHASNTSRLLSRFCMTATTTMMLVVTLVMKEEDVGDDDYDHDDDDYYYSL